MPAHPKVTTQEIVNQLIRWRGVVADAARALGMHRDSLYDRIMRLGLDLEGFRITNKAVMPIRGLSGMSGMEERQSRRVGVVEPHSVRGLQGSNRGRSIPAMQAAEKDEEAPTPVRSVTPRVKTLRIRPEFQDMLREAKIDFAARFRLETDEALILDQFIEEELAGWIARKLEAKAEQAPAKRGKGKE